MSVRSYVPSPQEGQLESHSPEVIVILYATTLGLGFFSLITSLLIVMHIQRRISHKLRSLLSMQFRRMVASVHAVETQEGPANEHYYGDGVVLDFDFNTTKRKTREHTTADIDDQFSLDRAFEDFYSDQLDGLFVMSQLLFLAGTFLLIICAILMMIGRFSYSMGIHSASIIFASFGGLTLIIPLILQSRAFSGSLNSFMRNCLKRGAQRRAGRPRHHAGDGGVSSRHPDHSHHDEESRIGSRRAAADSKVGETPLPPRPQASTRTLNTQPPLSSAAGAPASGGEEAAATAPVIAQSAQGGRRLKRSQRSIYRAIEQRGREYSLAGESSHSLRQPEATQPQTPSSSDSQEVKQVSPSSRYLRSTSVRYNASPWRDHSMVLDGAAPAGNELRPPQSTAPASPQLMHNTGLPHDGATPGHPIHLRDSRLGDIEVDLANGQVQLSSDAYRRLQASPTP